MLLHWKERPSLSWHDEQLNLLLLLQKYLFAFNNGRSIYLAKNRFQKVFEINLPQPNFIYNFKMF